MVAFQTVELEYFNMSWMAQKLLFEEVIMQMKALKDWTKRT
jgi:hypothetical protein